MIIKTLEESASTSKSWRLLFEIMNAYAYSQALFTACDLDLFTRLEERPDLSQQEIAEALGVTLHSARVLLLGLCAGGMLIRDPERLSYRNSESASSFLVAGKRSALLSYVRFNAEIQRVCMMQLTASVREGKNRGLDAFPGAGDTLYERLKAYPELEELFQSALGTYSSWLASYLERVSEFRLIDRLLDVAGGDGTTALRLCEALPDLRVTVLETASVCSIGKKRVAAAEARERIHFVVGDAFKPDWPPSHDAVLMAHFPEIFDEHRLQLLYRNAHRSLPRTGLLFLWLAVSNKLETGGLQAAKTSLYFLAAASGGGMVYPISDHLQLLGELGFVVEAVYKADPIEHACIVARKP